MGVDAFQVLVIEDDPMVAEVNRAYVEEAGPFTVVGIARTAEEGLAMASALTPDLVLLDIYLPGLSGLEALREIRRRDLPCDVLAVTAARDVRTVQDVLRNGAVDYIVKPFQFERLRATLLTYAEMRRRLREEVDLSQAEIDQFTRPVGAAPGAVPRPPDPTLSGGRVPASSPAGGSRPPLGTSAPGAVPLAKAVPGGSGAPGPTHGGRDLPKGLTEWTLRQVLLHLVQAGRPLSAAEVARGIGLARVTVRRYLDYLVQQGRLGVEMQYNPVGRPVYRYFLR